MDLLAFFVIAPFMFVGVSLVIATVIGESHEQ